MRKSKSNSGFTLIELLITISIIAIIAAAAVPGFVSSMADNRASNLTEDLVRIGRRARAEPMGTGRAHRLAYTRVEPLGLLTLFRGNSNRCNSVAAGAWVFVDDVDAQDYTSTGDPNRVQLIDFVPNDPTLASVEICYQPNGASLIRNNGGIFTESISPGGIPVSDVLFRVTRTLNSTPRGVTRFVLFPFGGSARTYRPPAPQGGTGG